MNPKFRALELMTPGQRMAARGMIGSRPGQPDYAEMQLIDLSHTVQAHAYVQHLYGKEVQIRISKVRGVLRIEVAPAPSTP